jgi:hypothetical protein
VEGRNRVKPEDVLVRNQSIRDGYPWIVKVAGYI